MMAWCCRCSPVSIECRQSKVMHLETGRSRRRSEGRRCSPVCKLGTTLCHRSDETVREEEPLTESRLAPATQWHPPDFNLPREHRNGRPRTMQILRWGKKQTDGNVRKRNPPSPCPRAKVNYRHVHVSLPFYIPTSQHILPSSSLWCH